MVITEKPVGRPKKKHWAKIDPLDVVGKNPRFTYKWNLQGDLEWRKREGWEVCLDSVDGKEGLRAGSGIENDLFIYREKNTALVLCKLPIELKEERDKYYHDLGLQKAGAAKDSFKTEAVKAGLALPDKDYE